MQRSRVGLIVALTGRVRCRENLPTLLDGLAIAELPEVIAGEYLADGRLEAILTDWSLTKGGLYFVTPSARARPAKVAALSDFFVEHLSKPSWRWPK